MSMQAVGIYIRTLRLGRKLTAQQVGNAAGTNQTYVWRVEKNQLKSPGMALVFKIVAAVRGRGEDIMKLMIQENPTEEYARALAKEALLTPDEKAVVEEFFATDGEMRVFFEEVYKATSHNKTLQTAVRSFLSGFSARDASAPVEEPPKTSRRPRKK